MMVNDHYPYEMAISLGIYPIFRHTHIYSLVTATKVWDVLSGLEMEDALQEIQKAVEAGRKFFCIDRIWANIAIENGHL